MEGRQGLKDGEGPWDGRNGSNHSQCAENYRIFNDAEVQSGETRKTSKKTLKIRNINMQGKQSKTTLKT